jgi:hypothetical protein
MEGRRVFSEGPASGSPLLVLKGEKRGRGGGRNRNKEHKENREG